MGDHVIKAWSSTQTVIALSTGEAELYALNKASAQGLGLQSLLKDMGIELEVRVHTDATTGRAIVTRRGLGKVRHIAVNELWMQEKVNNGTVSIHKIKNKFNLADLMTKYLSKDEIGQIMDFMQHEYKDGRYRAAPELSMISDDNLLHYMNLRANTAHYSVRSRLHDTSSTISQACTPN